MAIPTECSAEESTTEHESPDGAGGGPNSTTVLGPDFAPQSRPKMVVPIPDGGGGSTGSHQGRNWQTILFPIVVLLLLLHITITVVMLRWMWTLAPTTQPLTEHVETPQVDGATPASPAPHTTDENPPPESPEELAARRESEVRAARLGNEIAVKEVRSAKLSREITAKENHNSKLNKEIAAKRRSLAIAEAELEKLRQEIVLATNELGGMNRTIARHRRKLKGYKMAVAQLEGRVRQLTALASRKKIVVDVLKKELALIKNADGGGRNHRTPQKSKARAS